MQLLTLQISSTGSELESPLPSGSGQDDTQPLCGTRRLAIDPSLLQEGNRKARTITLAKWRWRRSGKIWILCRSLFGSTYASGPRANP